MLFIFSHSQGDVTLATDGVELPVLSELVQG